MTDFQTETPSAFFVLRGAARLASKSGIPASELRALARAVQAAHPLKGAIRLIGENWVVGIKCPTNQVASDLRALLCFRWDGNFGSAVTLTADPQKPACIARSWIWSRHPSVTALRVNRGITIVTVYNGDPISVIKAEPGGSAGGFEIATDITSEDEKRPHRLLLELNEKLAYWETFVLSPTWDKLLRAGDYLQIGWCREFRTNLIHCALPIRSGLEVPELDEESRKHWTEGERQVPQEFWDTIILRIRDVLRGGFPLLQFVREHSLRDLFAVIADPDERREGNPFNDLRWIIGGLAECAMLAETKTHYGKKATLSTVDRHHTAVFDIPTADLTIDDTKKYWENLPGAIALNVGDLVTASAQPADLSAIIDQIKALRLGCDRAEAESAITTMTDEANILNRWTIPWGARVEVRIGPFTEVDFFAYGDEISVLLKTPDQHYRWAAFNLRKGAWNFVHLFRNRSESPWEEDDKKELCDEIELAFKLLITSIVRDFVVLEERESAFSIRRDPTLHGRPGHDSNPRVVYIPRIRYVHAPDTRELEHGLEYGSRRPHHVRAHLRRADMSSPLQRILGERYGFRLEPGFTFVRPHQRGGIAPDREIIYRSRSAMQSLFGRNLTIESNSTSDWFRFERDVHDALVQEGLNVDHVAAARNGDAGVDIFAESASGSEFWAIQCKCYAPKRKINPATVRELIGALASYPAGTRGMIVTTSGYSSGAVELAKRSEIELRLLRVDADLRRCLVEVT